MALTDAVLLAGLYPIQGASQAQKKRYSEILSAHLAQEVADGLRRVGLPDVRPSRGGPGERAFQGGLGPKKVDVTYADERHGLMLAVSIKSITAAPFGKNLKNRFADLCTEAITLHMRFPYSVICGLFEPVTAEVSMPRVQLFDALTEGKTSEEAYFRGLKDLFNRRNPHVALEEDIEPLGGIDS